MAKSCFVRIKCICTQRDKILWACRAQSKIFYINNNTLMSILLILLLAMILMMRGGNMNDRPTRYSSLHIRITQFIFTHHPVTKTSKTF
jgi:hypothetical protein